eukprot:scaffold106879_cov36-Prasinocladus_malaysianus.AAC.1
MRAKSERMVMDEVAVLDNRLCATEVRTAGMCCFWNSFQLHCVRHLIKARKQSSWHKHEPVASQLNLNRQHNLLQLNIVRVAWHYELCNCVIINVGRRKYRSLPSLIFVGRNQ